MSADAGSAYIKFKADTKGLNAEVARQVQPIARTFGTKFGKALGPVMDQQAKHLHTFSQGAKIATVAGAGLAVVVGKDLVQTGMAFEKQMSVNAAVSGANAKQLGKLEKQSIKLGKATFYSAGEAATAQGELVKGGLSVQQVLGGGLPAALALAEAGELDLATAATTTVNAMKLFGLNGKESAQVADMLATAANTTTADVEDFAMALSQGGSVAKLAGYNMNETVTILEALAEAGIKNSDAGTSMKVALIQLLKPSEKQKKLQEELGLKLLTSNGNLKDAAGLSEELRRVTEGMTKAERTKTLATLVGTDGVRTANAIYEQTPKKLRALEKANAKQGTAQEVAAKKMDNFAGKWEQFKGSLETTEIQIYKGISPALDTLAEAGEHAANHIGDIFSNENLDTGQKLERIADYAGKELGKLWEKADIPEHAAEAFAAAAPVVAEAAAHTAVFAAEEFGKAFIHAPFIAKVAMGAWAINFIGGRSAFVGVGKLFGRQFGASFSREAVATSAAAQIPEKLAAQTAAASTAPVALPAVARQSSFIGPGTGAAQKAAIQAAAIHDAELYTSYLGIPDLSKQFAVEGKASSREFVKSLASGVRSGAPVVASSVAAMGGRLAQGAVTWGLGGYVVGEMTKELTHGQLGDDIGAALQGAGVGAAIGSAIAPGIGTAVGAAIGGAGGYVMEAINGHKSEFEKRGEEEGERFIAGYEKNLPKIEKMIGRGFIGTPSHTKNVAEVPGSGIHIQTTTGGSGLRGQRGRLEAQLNHPQTAENKAKIEAEIAAISKAIRQIEKDRALFRGTLARMSGDALNGVGAINKDLKAGLAKADESWGHGTKAWRKHAVEAMQSARKAIKEGMAAGVVDTEAGQKRINVLLRKINLTSGKDPVGIAEGVAKSFKEAGQITKPGVKGLIHDLDAMPKGARIKGIESIEGMTQAWAQGHPKLEKQVNLLTKNIENKFGSASKAAEQGQRKSLQHIIEANTGASSAVAEALSNIGGNLTSALKALGVHNIPEFKIQAEALAHHHGLQTGGPVPGTFTVPGSGSGDKVPMMLPPGTFIENREAARLPFQTGGLTPVILEPKERVWLPHAVNQVGLGNLMARNAKYPRFQGGGLMSGNLPHPMISGADPLRGGAQKGVDSVWKPAQRYLRSHMEPPRVLRMLRAGEEITSKGFPYAYGGGHGSFGIQPVDCSGLVSYILHAGNFINAPMAVAQGTGLYTLGESGPGKYFTWGVRGTSGQAAHTMISVKRPGNKGWAFFESGGSGGGAHEDSGWDGNFQFRHMPGFQRGGQIPGKAKEVISKYGQEAFDPHSKHFVGWGYQLGGTIPRLPFSVGGSVPDKKGILVGASTYGGPADNVSNPTYGAAGPSHPLAAQLSFAELAMGKALGGLQFGTPLKISRGGKSIVAYKEDIGLGGGDVAGHNRAIDLWYNAAQALGVVGGGTNAWLGTVRVSSAAGTKGQNAKEEKEHTYKEDVPATYNGLPAKNSVHFPSVPKNLDGINREIEHWTSMVGKYRQAIKAARKANRPALVQDLQHNLTDVQNHLRDLRNAKVKLRVEKAHKRFTKTLARKFKGLTGMEGAIEAARTAYEKRSEVTEHLVDLEPLQPPLPPEPKLPDTASDAERTAAHNAYEQRREAAERDYVGKFSAYVEGTESPAYGGILASEATWRNAVLTAERAAAGDWQNSNALGGFEGRFEGNIVDNVENQAGLRAAMQRISDEVKKWQHQLTVKGLSKDARKGLEKKIAEAIKNREDIAHVKIPFLKFKEGELRTKLGEARELFYPGKAGGGISGAEAFFELLSNPQVPNKGTGTFEESLRDVQGINWPGLHDMAKVLPSTPDAHSYGGAIWDTQMAIQELGLKISQAAESVQEAQLETPGASEQNTELLELEKELRIKAEKELAVDRTLRNTIGDFENAYGLPPYGGTYHTGGVVPGPTGAERTAIVKGGEPIFTEDQAEALGVAINDGGGQPVGGGVTVLHGDLYTDRKNPVEQIDWDDPRLAGKLNTLLRKGKILGQGRGTRGPR